MTPEQKHQDIQNLMQALSSTEYQSVEGTHACICISTFSNEDRDKIKKKLLTLLEIND
jgi:hypothetical protein